MTLPRIEHGNGCYSRGCRCRVGKSARAATTRRYKELAGFEKRFGLLPWREYVAGRARSTGVGVAAWCEARGIPLGYLSRPAAVRWDVLDRLCCAAGVPTVALYPEFAKRELVAL